MRLAGKPVLGAPSAWAPGSFPGIKSLAGRLRSLITPAPRAEGTGPKVLCQATGATLPPANVPWSILMPTPMVEDTDTFLR